MPKCAVCSHDLDADAFDARKDGSPKKSCRTCLKKVAEKAASANESTKKRKGGGKQKPKRTSAAPQVSPIALELVRSMSFGFTSRVVDDVLQVTQQDADGNDLTFSLGKDDLAALFDHFGAWADAT